MGDIVHWYKIAKNNVARGTVEISFDGLEPLKTACRFNCRPATSIYQFYIVTSLHCAIKQLPPCIRFNLVRGHQGKSRRELTRIEQMSVTVDAKDKLAL